MCALSFFGQRGARARRRHPSRWLAQSRSRCGSDHRARAGSFAVREAAGRVSGHRTDGAAELGPGKFDAELELDGKAFRPDGKTAATLIPPAFGQAGVSLHTWIGWGSTPHWNAFVANL